MTMNDSLLPDQPQPADEPAYMSGENNPAANLIRQKIAAIYNEEPDASTEIREAAVIRPRSVHQQFMYDLSRSGKTIVEIQTAWHNYYLALPDKDKHEVWQEFYDSSQLAQPKPPPAQPPAPVAVPKPIDSAQPIGPHRSRSFQQIGPLSNRLIDLKQATELKNKLIARVASRQRLSAKQHVKSLVFGLSMGVLVIVIFLFSFFNQVIITPFIQPSRHIGNLPLIITADSMVSDSETPQVIIPKINVEIPVDYSVASDDETLIEDGLLNGVVHYPSTVLPGQDGNAAFFGHSSNNIFNPGKYKFAFVLLHELVPGDVFYLTYQNKVYAYQVFSREIVSPNDVSVLGPISGKVATATLITCDPPGTSINRLVVSGIQISPDPSSNTNPAPSEQTVPVPTQLASNGPSLWSRLWNDIF
jgi:LPXTG-site transpeptidase (sortase) family protein